jgi:hypothetical protein
MYSFVQYLMEISHCHWSNSNLFFTNNSTDHLTYFWYPMRLVYTWLILEGNIKRLYMY